MRRRREVDHLPLVARGATGEVRRRGRDVLKVAHPLPEARARLLEEVRVHRLLEREGFPVPALRGWSRAGFHLVRAWVDGRPPGPRLSRRHEAALFALRCALFDFEERHGVRVDFSPSNLLLSPRGVHLVDGGPRLAAPRFVARTRSGFRREWRAWFRSPPRPRLRAPALPPSGRFHVETRVGVDRRARLAWVNEPLLRRLGLKWPRELLLELAHWSTTAPPSTTRPSTRYTDGVGLDLRRGPRGDGRVILLGEVDTADGVRHLSAKGVGPTPLAWKGRAFHEDGRVSFPRTLWEVTVADELARLGFDTPEYLCVATSGATTIDNTRRRWPAAVGVRASPGLWRLGHLRRFPELRALVPCDLDRFCDALGGDLGRADALQIHCFNATPGNVRLDGHLIDYSTVRFMRHHLPHFRFFEGAWTINRSRAVWGQQAMLFATLVGASPRRALRRYLRAWERGFYAGLAQVFGLDPAHFSRALVERTLALRAVRGDDEVNFDFFDQRVRGPRFDLLGRAPQVMRSLALGLPAPWRAMARGAPSDAEARLATRWLAVLKTRRRLRPARSWDEVVRPFLEPERLARLLYGRTTPRSLRAWATALAPTALPEGHYDYRRARALASRLGHVALTTLAGTTEVVVGLTPALRDRLVRALRRVLGRKLVGVVVHGSRLVDRRELRRRAPRLFTHGDLRNRGRDGVREFGPSRACSSDLDLKVFVRGPTSAELERRVARALRRLGAWFPLGGSPRQRLLPTRHATTERAFRAWNGRPRFALFGKEPIPEQQAAVLI